jgi:Big-like domain-containing protein/fibronectin type III domain protein
MRTYQEAARRGNETMKSVVLLSVVLALSALYTGCTGLTSAGSAKPGGSTPLSFSSSPATSSISSNAATIGWGTTVPASSQIDYGTTSAYGSQTFLDGNMVTSHAEPLSGLQASQMYHYRVTSKDGNNNAVTSVDYTFTTSAAPDTTPPTVSITSPANGVTVSGTITVSANATDNVAVASVQFQVDGGNTGSPVTAAPYTYLLNTTTLTKGSHTLTAVAKDTSNNAATSSPVTVTVNNNTTSDTTPPTVSITSPANGASVSGTITVSATATDPDSPVSYVQFQVDGGNTGGQVTAAPYTISLDTTKLSNASHTLKAIAADPAGNTGNSTTVTVTVNNNTPPDTTPPSVPTGLVASAASSSQITLVWSASTDNVGVAGYRVYRSGSQVGTSGNTSFLDGGLNASTQYTYTVAAYDAAGNVSAQSAPASATTLSASSGGGIPSALGWFQIPNTKTAPVCSNAPGISGNTGCAAVISAWNSGVADTKRNRLVFMGGGHSDYAGNEVYALDLNTLSLVRLTNPSLPPVLCVAGLTNPTAPNSRHTYGGLSYIPDSDNVFLFGGNVWRASTGCQPSPDPLYVGYAGRLSDTWTLDLGTLAWKRQDPLATSSRPVYGISGLGEGIISDYDPVTKKVIVTDNVNWYSFDQASNAYTLLNQGYQHINYLQWGAIDPGHRLFLTFGGNQVFAYSLTTNTIQDWTAQVTGCDPIVKSEYPGLAYDPTQGKIVGWAGGNTVYVFDAGTKSCVAQTFPNGPPAQQTDGTFGRFRYFPALGVFGLVNDWQQNAFTLRLTPASGGGTGSAPVISGVATSGITTSSALTGWTTDVPATSQAEYGSSTSYGSLTPLDATLLASHAAAITSLSANTLYHYRVHSKNSGGMESISGDFAFVTSTSGDTTPPTVSITSPAPGAALSSTVTVSANASDNVGVAGVQFLLDGLNLGAEVTSAPYSVPWDTTTAVNGSHALSARARDAAGNSAMSVVVTVTVSNASQGAAQDFATRCAAAGVTLCQGFDNPADFLPNKYLYADWQGLFSKGTMDTTVTASGAGSLRFEIDPFTGANVAGNWTQSFGQDFGQGTTFYVQFRQMFSDTMLTNNWGDTSSNTSWKQSIFHKSGHTCTDVELTTVQHYLDGIPIMYTDCGSRGLYTNGGTPPYLLQQGDYNCAYGTNIQSDPNCFKYVPNVWITFYYKVTIGHWSVADSSIDAWGALPGQPLKQWIKMTNFMLGNGSPGNDYNTITLLPYMTGKNAALNHPVAYTWYDELIVSSQPIAPPK